MADGKVLIYGANGYSGRLAARHATEFGVNAVLAGRSTDSVKKVAEETGHPYRIFPLTPSGAVDDYLKDIAVVLNCAGPFSRTANLLVQACLRTGTHYTDITGELDVIERLSRLGDWAVSAGSVVIPATGFDVVPTDCLAKYLSEQMPEATHLNLAFMGTGGLSHGTATTMVENLGQDSFERQNGHIVPVPFGHRTRMIDFGNGEKHCASIPWGDVASAYHTTGIPNVVTFTAVPRNATRMMKLSSKFGWLLQSNPVQRLIKARLDATLDGPSDADRKDGRSFIYGEVLDGRGGKRAARLETRDGYTLTYMTSLKIAAKLASEEFEPGFHTPAELFGADFILEFPGSTRVDVD